MKKIIFIVVGAIVATIVGFLAWMGAAFFSILRVGVAASATGENFFIAIVF